MPADASGLPEDANGAGSASAAADAVILRAQGANERLYADAYAADGLYGGGQLEPAAPFPAQLDAPRRTTVPASVPAGMLVAGLGLLGMIARRRTFLR